MINFRYHLISLVAVFLALSIGIVMGSTVIDRAIVDSLRNRIDVAEKNSIERKTENDRLRNAVEKQDEQDTALAAHSVRGYLTGQTVHVLIVGDISDSTRVETQELLATSGARLGSVVKFSKDFLEKDRTNVANELLKLENVSALTQDNKNRDQKISKAIQFSLNIQSGNSSELPLPYQEILQVLGNAGAITQNEITTTAEPVQPVSFIVLIDRQSLSNERTAAFIQNLYSDFALSVGFEGDDTTKPSRQDSIEALGDQLAQIAVLDNAESPSGRAALIIAHSQNLAGVKQTYGVSDKAQAPAPVLSGS